jgi:translation elongation factor P/translation initiation factor 5A
MGTTVFLNSNKNDGFTYRMFYMDDMENYLRIKSNDKLVQISLKLKSEKKLRRIGTVTKSTKTIDIKRKRGKHLHIKSNSYGFNYEVLNNKKSFDTVRLSDEISDWKIPLDFIMKNGKFLYFLQQGFEKQIFVTLEQIEPYRVKKEENRRY